ncbi:MAG: hypothetical protein QOD94_2106 [Alphaproteobacteria bacterium]|jgi:hypothetical protein|nr:hypothetical protein [Alphaproteobacteria bacterium]
MALIFRCDGGCGTEYANQRGWERLSVSPFPPSEGEQVRELIFCVACWQRIERSLHKKGWYDPTRFTLGDICECDTADGPRRGVVSKVPDDGKSATLRFADGAEVLVRWADLNPGGGWRRVLEE